MKRNCKLSPRAKKVSKRSRCMCLQVNAIDAEASSKFFLLKWSHTIQPDRNMFAEILLASQPADVTLECADGTIKSHKVILQSCSEFFRDTFEENQCDEPHVTMRGVIRIKELYLVLRFIYLGQVQVRQYEIHKFLNAAKFLQIDGMNFPNDSTKYLYIPPICLQELTRKEYLENGTLCMTSLPNEYRNHNEQNGASKTFVVTSKYTGGCTVYDNRVKNVIRNPPNNQYKKMYQVDNPCHASKRMNLDPSTCAFFKNQWSTNTTVKPHTTEPHAIKNLENNSATSQSSPLPNITKYNNRFANTSPMACRYSQNVPSNSPYNTTPYNVNNMSQDIRPACSMGLVSNSRSSSTLKATSAPQILSNTNNLLIRYQPYTKSTISSTTTNTYSVSVTTALNNTNSDIFATKHTVGSEGVLSHSSYIDTPKIPQSINQYSSQGDYHYTSALEAQLLDNCQDALLSCSPATDDDEMPDEVKTLRGIWSCEIFPEKQQTNDKFEDSY